MFQGTLSIYLELEIHVYAFPLSSLNAFKVGPHLYSQQLVTVEIVRNSLMEKGNKWLNKYTNKRLEGITLTGIASAS